MIFHHDNYVLLSFLSTHLVIFFYGSCQPLEVIAESCHKVNHDSEFNQDNSDREDEEDEENVTVKEKLWNFLIT